MKKIVEILRVLYLLIYKTMIKYPRKKREYILYSFVLLTWMFVVASVCLEHIDHDILGTISLIIAFFPLALCIIAVVAIINLNNQEIEVMTVLRDYFQD